MRQRAGVPRARAREGKQDQYQPVEIIAFRFQIQVKSRSEQVDR
jgi:hypothetical protein